MYTCIAYLIEIRKFCSKNLVYKGVNSEGFGPVERKPLRMKAQQNEIPIERNPIRTTTRQKESPTERKAQFEPVYNKLCVGTVFAASGNVTTDIIITGRRIVKFL